MPEDNTIDVSHMTDKEYRQYMRRLEQLSTCPCMTCQAECNRWINVDSCASYQRWREYNRDRRTP